MNPLADMFVQIVNGARVKKTHVFIPYSKIKMEIAHVLQQAGFIGEIARRGKKNKRMLEIELVYRDQKPAVEGAKLISKQSQRMYSGYRSLGKLSSRRGVTVVSTPKGIMTTREAYKQKVGGELIGRMW